MKLNSFFKALVTLVSGTAAAHLITLLSLPVVSRLYNKEQFGELAVLMSSSAVLAIVMTLKLEMALFNRSSTVQRYAIVYSSAVMALFFLCISLLAVTLFQAQLLELYKQEISYITLFFIPIAAFFISLFVLITNFAIVERQFKDVAKVKVQRSLAQVILQVTLPFLSVGLILAESFSRGIGIFSLYKKNFSRESFKGFDLSTLVNTWKSNHRFLKFTSLAALCNVTSLQFPTLFIASIFGVSGAGVYLLTNRLVALPVSLLGQSMAQVYSSEFAARRKESQYLLALFKKMVVKSFIFSSLLFMTGGVIAEWGVVFLLGPQWGQVADFIVILIPMLILQFTVTPISNTLNMLECQHLMLLWDFLRLFLMVILAMVVIIEKLSVEQFLLGYSGSISLCYIILLCISWFKLKQTPLC